MDCTEARKLLDACADGELDAATRGGVEQHVESCAKCGAALERRRDFIQLVRRRVPIEPTPAGLRRRVLDALEREAVGGRPARLQRWYEQLAATWSQPRYRLGIAVAAAVLLLFSLLPLLRAPQGAMLEEVAERYAAMTSVPPELEMRTSDVASLREYFRGTGELDFENTVPDLRKAGFNLVGGRLSSVGPHRATLTVYEGEHGRVACQRFRPARIDLPGGGTRFGPHLMYKVDGVTVRVVVEGDVVCLLATDMAPETFARVLSGE